MKEHSRSHVAAVAVSNQTLHAAAYAANDATICAIITESVLLHVQHVNKRDNVAPPRVTAIRLSQVDEDGVMLSLEEKHRKWRNRSKRGQWSKLCSNDGRVIVYVPPPHAGHWHYQLCFQWARVANFEQRRQYKIRCRMALVQSMGGGWASVRNAEQALKCTLELYSLASEIQDESTKRKCRVFVGWALLWHHERVLREAAVQRSTSTSAEDDRQWLLTSWALFASQMRENHTQQDEVNWNRCFAALRHCAFHYGDAVTDLDATSALMPMSTASGAPSATQEAEEGEAGHDASGGSAASGDGSDILGSWTRVFTS